ncbi:uncharacterized protein LOC131438509 [Malaya genurostris]|uniref:uncharacterized protein LOC131438509 n=1 Tax=Malaya genurostris TaxID=325434 RepID=UPI0026F3AD37|nr:uncharacterized protein LOC131438509 [Malaya genurostris]
MSESNLDFTMTPCEACGEISTQNEEMIACDNCERWYHTRCVDVTAADKKGKKWFCPEDVCQAASQDYQKRKKMSRSKNNAEDSDSLTTKSGERQHPPVSPSLQNKIKEMEVEKKRLEEEMDAEYLLKVKELELRKSMREKKMRLERDLRERELQYDRELREKEIKETKSQHRRELQEKKDHLCRLKKIQDLHEAEMSFVKEQLEKVKLENSGKMQKSSVDPRQSSSKLQGRKGTPSRSPALDSKNLTVENEMSDENNDDIDDENIQSGRSDSESNSEAGGEAGGEADSDSEYSVGNGDTVPDGFPNGLGPQRTGPSRAQLTARNGLTKKLPVFSGRPEEWPLFFGAYQASNEACGFSDVENLVRLQECLKGQALECVRGQLLLPKSVPRVIAKLRQLYGRPEQLLQSHLEKVRKLEPPRSDKLASFIPFGIQSSNYASTWKRRIFHNIW